MNGRGKLIYLEWWDAVERGGPNVGGSPEAVIFRGYTTLIEESEHQIIVAHFTAGEGEYFDRLAVPRVSIVKLRPVELER